MKNVRFVLILIICLSISEFIIAQKEQVKFYEFIKGDSIRMFFNGGGAFTEKHCAVYHRLVRIDSAGDFNSHFIDLSIDSVVIGKGCYIHGKKQGYFEVYYQSGSLKCKGNYKDNLQTGLWEFFYENGLVDRTLMYTDAGMSLLQSFDNKGKILVNDGHGKFKGMVANNFPIYNITEAEGLIVNGKPSGKWTSRNYTEYFTNGQFIEGSYFPSVNLPKQNYKDKPVLNTFFLWNHMINLELYNIINCPDTTKVKKIQYNFDYQKFESALHDRIQQSIEENSFNKMPEFLKPGLASIIIQFTVNGKGKAIDFKQLTRWGNQFFLGITNVIKYKTNFSQDIYQTMYFHIIFLSSKDGQGGYLYWFSRSFAPK